jgi:hypothetical protein
MTVTRVAHRGSGRVMFAFAGKHASYGAAGAAQVTSRPGAHAARRSQAGAAGARRLSA